MDILKSHWETSGTHVRLGVPITKVDQERRIVSGFATLNNLDQQGDIVLASASKSAFERFSGNLREMHDRIAAGRVVAFREEQFVDAEGNIYEGIYVDAYVSKGAVSTWEKVLDGTLTGFSIGGRIEEQEQMQLDTGQWVSVVSRYTLSELSLVDAPANQLANILSVQKAVDGTQELSGISVDVQTLDVYWCKEDGIATIGKQDCSSCGKPGESIGWIESSLSTSEKAEAVVSLAKAAGYINTAKPAVIKEEGVEEQMADENVITDSEAVEKAEAVEEVSEVEAAADSDNTAEEVSKSDEVEETTEAAVEEESGIDWQAKFEELSSQISELTASLAGVSKSVEDSRAETIETLKAIGDAVEKGLVEAKASATETAKSLGEQFAGLEASIVTRKSADREAEAKPVEKSAGIFAGRFTANTLN